MTQSHAKRAAFVVVLLVAAPGCLPDGPHEFYRTALQAKTEYIDSMSRIVDEPSAKHFDETANKIYTQRIEGIRDGMNSYKMDGTFTKMQNPNFNVNQLKPDIKAQMEMILGEFMLYALQTKPNQLRMAREHARLGRLSALHHAHRLKETQEGRSPDPYQCPSLDKISAPLTEKDLKVDAFGLLPDNIAQKLITFGNWEEGADLLKKAGAVGAGAIVAQDQLQMPPLQPLPDWAVNILLQNRIVIPDLPPPQPAQPPPAPPKN